MRDYKKDYEELVRACLSGGEDADFDCGVVGRIITLIENQNQKTWTQQCIEEGDRCDQGGTR